MSDKENKNNKGWPLLIPNPDDWHHSVKEIISALGIILALILILGIFYLVADILNLYFSPEIENRFSNLRTSLFILAALIGAPFLVWRTLIAKQQTSIADQQAETARDRAYTELFTKAIEQLGAEKPAKKVITGEDQNPTTVDDYVPNIEVRIGAIYALERIMNDSEKDAPAIVDTLAAYVRENCGKATMECEIPKEDDFENTSEWVSAIREYIGNPWRPAEGSLAARAKALAEQPQVNRADIKTALTVLGRRPDWLKNPENYKTETTAKPDLRNVNFQGWDLSKFDLSHCNLSGVQMQGAKLSYAQMQGADLSFAKMQGANLTDAKMQGANLQYAQMQGADLSDAKMQGAVLSHAKMQGADLSGTKMQGANLSGAEMQGADLSGAKMQGADLSGAKIDEVQITSARKTAASVIWVDFTKSKFEFEELQAQLPDMFGHQTLTTLPKKMDPPDFWSKENMKTGEGMIQYLKEWNDFKKEKGVE